MSQAVLFIIFVVFLSLASIIVIYPIHRQYDRVQILSFIVLIVGTVSGYWQWGAFTKWADYLKQQEISQHAQTVMKSLKSPQQLIDKLKQHLQKKPNSAQGWFLLGRLYASQNQWQLANQSFFKAHTLKPENEQYAVNYAQSIWQTHHQTFTDDVRALFRVILEKNPMQPDALSMLAMDAYQQHDYQKAIDYWSSLLELIPHDSSESKMIRKAIVKARKALLGHGD